MRPSALLIAAVAVVVVGCGASATDPEDGAVAAGDPARGADLFAANCAQCHGSDALGTDAGPPLVHEYYVPSHHSDASFQAAVQRGVMPHHWDFGAMPPIEGVEPEEVTNIVAHVRSLQREAGLIE